MFRLKRVNNTSILSEGHVCFRFRKVAKDSKRRTQLRCLRCHYTAAVCVYCTCSRLARYGAIQWWDWRLAESTFILGWLSLMRNVVMLCLYKYSLRLAPWPS